VFKTVEKEEAWVWVKAIDKAINRIKDERRRENEDAKEFHGKDKDKESEKGGGGVKGLASLFENRFKWICNKDYL